MARTSRPAANPAEQTPVLPPSDRTAIPERADVVSKPNRQKNSRRGGRVAGGGAGQTRKAVPDESIPEPLAESLRAMISRHELRTGTALPKWIAVTSSLEGEGVTTVSRSLAALLAVEFGQRVCWFDCAWLSSSNDVDPRADRPTLSELAVDNDALSRAFDDSPISPSLRYLQPALEPTWISNPVVRSPQFGAILARLDADFDHIIFDMPPVLSNSGTLALMLCADATLVVVKHRSTSVSMLERTLQAIQPTPNLAVLLNRFEPAIPRRLLRMFGS